MNSDLLVIGDVSVDQYMEIDAPEVSHDPNTGQVRMCFFHGSKIPVSKFHLTLAGNATHVGIGAQKLGLKTAIYTELGDDEYAEQFIKEFGKHGIDVSLCRKNQGTNTNVHAIIVDESERTIFSYHEPRKYNLDFDKLGTPKWIYYTSLAKGFEEFQKKLVDYLDNNPDVVVAFNPGSIMLESNASELKNILKKTHVLFVNKQEANKLLEKSPDSKADLKELHENLHKLGPKLTLITDGSEGSSAFDGNEFLKLSAPKIEGEVVDKTGSGDSYAVAFLSALHYKKTLKEAMEWGNTNAANIVTRIGCIDGLLPLDKMPNSK